MLKIMKRVTGCMLLGLLLFPVYAVAEKTFYSNGNVDNNNGVPNRDLTFRDFDITPDGFITGVIVNQSNHVLKSVRLDMWTANPAETRVYWRKALNIGDMAPRGEYEVREPYSPLPDASEKIVYKFRIPSGMNFRN